MCGEKRQDRLDYYVPQGSPPHVRGKAKGDELGLSQTRITPACAGKRAAHSFQAVPPWDHPRMCGEKRNLSMLHFRRKGSPPHVRGKVQPVQLVHDALGITPAYAGKRGIRLAVDSKTIGSPPHVRGKECVNSARKLPVGITPACAGKRAILFRLLSLPRDHPRMCGEKTKKIP